MVLFAAQPLSAPSSRRASGLTNPKMHQLQATQKFDLVARSYIIRGEKPNKPVDATLAPNPNQMNKLAGHLLDGKRVLVAQRSGRGGMDFNKLVGGKVYAVAADGMSPVYEKGEDKKPTNKQKLEEGVPMFSASGFYLLSSRDYPAIDMLEAYTHLLENGALSLVLTDEQLAATQALTLEDDFSLELFESMLLETLDDKHSLVARFDADANKRRSRGTQRAREEADDANEPFSGPAFKELAASKKDGKAFALVSFQAPGGAVHEARILRQADIIDQDTGRISTRYFTPEEAVELAKNSDWWAELAEAVVEGQAVEIRVAQGWVMRTSVSFRRKVENHVKGVSNTQYGDSVYIKGALEGWCRGIVSLMHSMHPNFPNADYDAHHYVAALRQSEVGMQKKESGGWTPPVALQYDLASALFSKDPA